MPPVRAAEDKPEVELEEEEEEVKERKENARRKRRKEINVRRKMIVTRWRRKAKKWMNLRKKRRTKEPADNGNGNIVQDVCNRSVKVQGLKDVMCTSCFTGSSAGTMGSPLVEDLDK